MVAEGQSRWFRLDNSIVFNDTFAATVDIGFLHIRLHSYDRCTVFQWLDGYTYKCVGDSVNVMHCSWVSSTPCYKNILHLTTIYNEICCKAAHGGHPSDSHGMEFTVKTRLFVEELFLNSRMLQNGNSFETGSNTASIHLTLTSHLMLITDKI